MEDLKKRKLEETSNGQISPLPSEEQLRSLLDPLAKPQLVDLLAKLGSQYPSIAEDIKSVASADPVHRKLFVRGLAWNTTSETLCAAFRGHGEIEEGAVIVDKTTGKSRGYGFITYKHMESTQSALRAPSKLIDGRMAVCNLACEGLSGASTTPDLTQRKLYIGGLSPDVTSEILLNYFGRHGDIEEGSVAYDKDTNESRGFGFVTYKTAEAAKRAMDDPQKILGGRNVIVKLADSHKGKMGQTQLPAGVGPMAVSLPSGYPQPGKVHASAAQGGYTYPQAVATYPGSVYPTPPTASASYQTQSQISYAPVSVKKDPLGLIISLSLSLSLSVMFRRGNKSSKLWHGTKSCRVPVLVSSLILILVISILYFSDNSERPSSSFMPPKKKWNSSESPIQFHPIVEFRNGTDVIWQIPDSPKAVLFLAHGCNGRAVNFWDRSPNCSNCIGLPEERLIVLHALARKFAVLTVSSAGRCWSFGEERLIVKGIIRWWVEKEKLEKLPLVALGASSGGYFVSVLATDLRFGSITLMIAEGMFDQMDILEDYPPTLFVHMPKDRFRKKRIDEYKEVLRNKGIDVAEIKCMEIPLSPNFLADRIPGLDQTMSSKLFELFRDKGFVDKNGYMRNDGRAIRWKEALRTNKIILQDKYLNHHIQEELNLAFAYHEMTSLQSGHIFDWFESHMH